MSVLNGQYSIGAQGGYVNAQVTVALRSIDSSWIGWPTKQADVGTFGTGYTIIRNIPVVFPNAINGQGLRSYMDDYYYRIHITPPITDLGNLLSVQNRQIRVWNAYLTPVTILSVTEEGLDGATMAPPAGFSAAPFVLPALKEITYDIAVSLDGPPQLNATITFQNNAGPDAVAHLIGSRVVVFPFLPDWLAGIDETLSSRSSVLRSPDGDEQGISLRRKMRRSYAIPYTLRNELAQQAENLLFGWQGRLYGVPAWPEQTYLTANAAAGTKVLALSTADRTLFPKSLILVFLGKNAVGGEVREVLSVTPTAVTLKDTLIGTWPAGSRVVPVLFGAAAPQLQGTRLVPNLLQLAILFDMEPSVTNDNAPEVTPAITYRGYEVYLGRTNWRDSTGFSAQTDVMRVDFQTGVFRLQTQSGFSGIGRSHEWFLKTYPLVTAFRSWLKRRLGKTVGVWMTSATDDFTLLETVGAGSTAIIVSTNGYSLLVAQQAARRDIYIRLWNGTYYFRRINDSADLGAGRTQLTLDVAVGTVINPADVRQFSYLSFYKLAGDDNTIHWHAPGKAEAITGLIASKAP